MKADRLNAVVNRGIAARWERRSPRRRAIEQRIAEAKARLEVLRDPKFGVLLPLDYITREWALALRDFRQKLMLLCGATAEDLTEWEARQ